MKERKIKEIEENKIIDIFTGEFIHIWEDQGLFYFSTPHAILCFSEEEWSEFKRDIDKLEDI